ncbi:MAG TPA: sulfatase, partial [Myxococcota bacterium]|nr:sulfatase [Myxococcota bacterium]
SALQAYAWEQLRQLHTRGAVLIQTDTLRADHLPWYGYSRNTLPSLSAREGWLVVDRHYSSSSWTFPATASLLTSRYVRSHQLIGIRSPSAATAIGPFYQDYLPTQGVSVAWFNGNMSMERTNLLEGWETVESVGDEPENGAQLLERALAWVQSLPADQPFLVMVQPMDPHRPWLPAAEDQWTWANYSTAPFSLDTNEEAQTAAVDEIMQSGTTQEKDALAQLLRDVYDEELLGLDRGVEQFLQGLEAGGLAEDTLVVFTADHGESLFDVPGAFGHSGSLREELVHIPLAYYHPSFRSRVVEGCLSSHVDVLPTLTTVLGVEPMPDTDGIPFPCRDYAVSELFDEGDLGPVLDIVNVEARNIRVEVACNSGQVSGFDLSTDPAAVDRGPGQDLPDGLSLMNSLAAEVEAAKAAFPEVSCVWP